MSRTFGRLMCESSQWKMAVGVMKGNSGAVFKSFNYFHKFIH